MSAYIQSVGSYFPENVFTNDDLSHKIDTSHEWIYSHTGIASRHIADNNTAASDLGVKAALRTLQRADVKPSDIDMLLVSTSTPDCIGGLPSTACIIQEKLALGNIPAMDIVAACSGFIYALETARCYIESKAANRILIVSAEKYSTILNWQDRSTCVLFGDGAASVIVSRQEDTQKENRRSAIMPMLLAADGSKWQYLQRPSGGSRNPFTAETKEEDLYLQMNGRQVYNYAVSTIIELIDMTLERHALSIDDVAYIIPHQANDRMIDVVAKRKKYSRDKFFMNIEYRANTASASIPACLHEMDEKKLLKRGDALLLVSFGAGFTCGGGLLYW